MQSNAVCFPLWLFVGVASPEPQALCVVLAQVGGAEGGWVQQANDILPNYTRPIPVSAKYRWGCSVVCRISGVGGQGHDGSKTG